MLLNTSLGRENGTQIWLFEFRHIPDVTSGIDSGAHGQVIPFPHATVVLLSPGYCSLLLDLD